MNSVIRKALQKTPDQRYLYARAFAEAFQMAIKGEMPPDLAHEEDEEPPLTAPVAQPLALNPIRMPTLVPEPDPVVRPYTDQRLLLTLSGVIVVLVLIVLMLLIFGRPPVIPEPTASPTSMVTVMQTPSFSPTASSTATGTSNPTDSPTWTPSLTASSIPSETYTVSANPTALESPLPNENTLIAMVLATATAQAAETAAVAAQTPSATLTPLPPTETATTTPTLPPILTPTLFFPLGAPTDHWSPHELAFEDVVMVYVPMGCFIMGADAGDKNEQPAHTVCLENPFWIDKTEVSNRQFSAFGGKAAKLNNWTGDDLPRETISWAEAQTFCALRGARLPTEAEWEYAARGPQSLIYPWGNVWVEENAAYNKNTNGQAESVNNRVEGASWVGALGMSGNVWEWVSSAYQPYPYSAIDGRENLKANSTQRVARGGSWNASRDQVRGASRTSADPMLGYRFIGFRCARSAE